MAQDPDDYELWRCVVEELTWKGASMAEAIEGADLILQARRRVLDQRKRAPQQGADEAWVPPSATPSRHTCGNDGTDGE